jgi:hypothetical protein
MDKALGARFGETVLTAPHTIQWLSDNGPLSFPAGSRRSASGGHRRGPDVAHALRAERQSPERPPRGPLPMTLSWSRSGIVVCSSMVHWHGGARTPFCADGPSTVSG